MTWTETIIECLKDADISLIAYVPDISIHQVTRLMEADDYFHVVSATREEEAIGIATGAYAAGRNAAVFHAVERIRKHGQRDSQPVYSSPRSDSYVHQPARRGW